jgi:hypothetical protein
MIERRWRRNWKGIEELRRMEWDLVAWCSGKDEGRKRTCYFTVDGGEESYDSDTV